MLQILASEQSALSSARSLVYNEAFARAGMFLTFLSASLVALALVGQAMNFGRDFLVLAATLLVFDILIGALTVGRVIEAAIDDLRYIDGMNRIRRGYARLSPGVVPFLPGSVEADAEAVFAAYGSARVRRGAMGIWHGLSTTGGMLVMIVAVLSGALGAVVGLLVDRGQVVVVAAAVIGLVAALVILVRFGMRSVQAFEVDLMGRIPPQ